MFLGLVGLTACDQPRGAALSSEVLKEQESPDAPFQVMAVNRGNVAALASWPVTGWSGGYYWPNASQGSDSLTIRNGDHLNLIIWDSQQESLLAPDTQKQVKLPDLTVSTTGTVFVPYLDEIKVSGLTPDEARSKIQAALISIVPSAQVELAVGPGKLNSVDLVSGVPRPGSYPLPDQNYSILSLLAVGGGIPEALRNPIVRLIRDNKTYEISANRLLAESSKNIRLKGGDHIMVVDDERYFTAFGASGTQKLIYFDQEKITAMETLSMIGGLRPDRADPKGVLILREYPSKALRADGHGPTKQQVIFTFDLTTAEGLFAARSFDVNPDDTVLVSEAALVSTRATVGFVSAILGLGYMINNNSN
jgi:polysaccharide biosynthesis/export protein